MQTWSRPLELIRRDNWLMVWFQSASIWSTRYLMLKPAKSAGFPFERKSSKRALTPNNAKPVAHPAAQFVAAIDGCGLSEHTPRAALNALGPQGFWP